MAYDAALRKHPDRLSASDERSESPTIEVEVGGRKVRVRQQTVASGLGYGITRRLKRLFG
jgi:hypothetical protein